MDPFPHIVFADFFISNPPPFSPPTLVLHERFHPKVLHNPPDLTSCSINLPPEKGLLSYPKYTPLFQGSVYYSERFKISERAIPYSPFGYIYHLNIAQVGYI